MASVIEKEVVKGRDHSWNSELKPQVEVSRPSAVGGVEAATSARVADECNRISGQEPSGDEETAHADIVWEAKVQEPDSWKSFKVFKLLRTGDVDKTAVDTRRVLTRKTSEQ